MSELTPEDMDNLRHMLGAELRYHRKQWGFRNHFAPSPADIPSMKRLEAAGYISEGREYGHMEHFYHATEAGCKAAGLSKSRIKVALE